MTKYPSGFHWNLKGDRWQLFAPSGKVAATVYLKVDDGGHNWFAWDEDGAGGENSSEPNIEQAKITAESAVLRWGRHFEPAAEPEPATDQILDGIAHDLAIWEQQGPLDKPLFMSVDVAAPAAFLAEQRRRSRRGFTFVEIMVGMVITAIILASLQKWVPRHVADFWMTKGAAGVQDVISQAQTAAKSGRSWRPERTVGVRFVPDPQWPIATLADGTFDRTRPIAYSRAVPLVEVAPYTTGLVSVHRDGFPAGFVPAWRRLVLEQAPIGPDGYPAEPTNWYWQIRLGDRVKLNGWTYTVCGPVVTPHPEGYANVGPPGTVSPLDRGAGPVEFLYLVDGLDDDRDGRIDSGWNGLDDDLDGLTDEPDEWEAERWASDVPAEGLAAVPYEIIRRPVALEAPRTAYDRTKNSPVVVDGRKSMLPVNPLTGCVDLVFDELGGVSSPSFYSLTPSPPLGRNRYHFWVVPRADIDTPPDADGLAKIVSLDPRSGRVVTADAEPTDVQGSLAREDGR